MPFFEIHGKRNNGQGYEYFLSREQRMLRRGAWLVNLSKWRIREAGKKREVIEVGLGWNYYSKNKMI